MKKALHWNRGLKRSPSVLSFWSQQPCPGCSGKLPLLQCSSSFTPGLVFRFLTSLLHHLLRMHTCTSHWQRSSRMIWSGSILKCMCGSFAVQPVYVTFTCVSSCAHHGGIMESSSYLCYLNSLLDVCWVYKTLLFFPLGVHLPGQLCCCSTGQPGHIAAWSLLVWFCWASGCVFQASGLEMCCLV